jgi:hypothetical protein
MSPQVRTFCSGCAWVDSNEGLLDEAWSLDFSRVPIRDLGDFTPVVEVLCRVGERAKLIGLAFLPLTKEKRELVNGRPINFFYRNQYIDIIEPRTKKPVGMVEVTLALGFPEHEGLFCAPKAAEEEETEYEDDEDGWELEAARHGWFKPGSAGAWKDKARKKGWQPPQPPPVCYTTGS